MFYDAISVRYVDGYILEVEFEDGARGFADFGCIHRTGIFSRLECVDYFKQVYIHDGVLSWPPGDLDIAPEDLYSRATGISVENMAQ
ncbi:MAG: DUF2442 domain-containing protein [Candidatus Latescibacterota bacterium]